MGDSGSKGTSVWSRIIVEFRLWLDAWKGRRDNVVIALRRSPLKRSRIQLLQQRLVATIPYVITSGLALLIVQQITLHATYPRAAKLYLAAFILLAALGSHWLFTITFRACLSCMRLLSNAESAYSRDMLEPAILGRFSSREVLFGILWITLPGVWAHLAGIAILAGITAYVYSQLSATVQSDIASTLPVRFTAAGCGELSLWIFVLAVPASIILVLWSIALGRSLSADRQAYAIAILQGIAQVIWVPLALHNKLHWMTATGGDSEEQNFFALVLMPFIAGGVFLLSLISGQRSAVQRIWTALLVPVTAVMTIAALRWIFQLCYIDVLYQSHMRRLLIDAYTWISNLVWMLSCFALINPLGLPTASSIGFLPQVAQYNLGLAWYRLPGVLLFAVLYLIVLGQCAMQAIGDWRVAKD